jgi:hypothetical protein
VQLSIIHNVSKSLDIVRAARPDFDPRNAYQWRINRLVTDEAQPDSTSTSAPSQPAEPQATPTEPEKEERPTKEGKIKGAGRTRQRMVDNRTLERALDTTAKALATKAAAVKG